MNISHDDMLEAIQRTRAAKMEPKRLIDGTDATHDAIAADVAAFLARGGRIEQGVSVQLRCGVRTDVKASSTDRRWVTPDASGNERARRRAHALRRNNIVLPGSLSAQTPTDSDLKPTRAEATMRGDKFYLPPHPCFRGHAAPRLTSSGTCVECARINRAEYHKRRAA